MVKGVTDDHIGMGLRRLTPVFVSIDDNRMECALLVDVVA